MPISAPELDCETLPPPNGIDGSSGCYLHPPASAAEIAALARGERPDRRESTEVREWLRRSTESHLGPRAGIDPKDLEATGWGVVFPRQTDPAVREALAPLLEHRRNQAAARRETFYREFAGDDGLQPQDTKASFLERHGAGGGGPADPRQVPYYLLLVGGPDAIPFELQHQLDVQYAVGRVGFDTPEEYARYAEGVVAAETGAAPSRPHRASVFAASIPGDLATGQMAEHLARPLATALAEGRPEGTVTAAIGAEATKAQLQRFLGGDETPGVLFTATHGMGFPAGDPRQRDGQGALLCQDWPGPTAGHGPVPPEHYFGAVDVADGACPAGLLSFHFSCHSGGTPQRDAYGEARTLAPCDFLARLPQRLLAHPKGGALAVVGHVERTWGHSFLWKGEHSEIFADVLGLLLDGWPVGAALEAFGQRYAALATELVEEQRLATLGKQTPPEVIARLWTAVQDARNYILLGDPAVRLPAPVIPAISPAP